jgi:hypothetical protein
MDPIIIELTVQDPVLLELATAPEYYINPKPSPALPLPEDLDEYPDDEAAKDNGLEVGDWYLFSQGSDVGTWGVPKRIMS